MGYYILYGFLWVGGLLPLRILYFFFGYLFLSDLLSVEIQTPGSTGEFTACFPGKRSFGNYKD